MAVRIEAGSEPIPGYTLIERLGGGGFGEVWKAEAPGGLLKAIKVVYESERFPPATIGYAYNLAPELREGIRGALLGFDLKGTKLEGEFGAQANKLVPVDYKNDWATARRIDQLALNARKGQ